jgi:hypothetical protein
MQKRNGSMCAQYKFITLLTGFPNSYKISSAALFGDSLKLGLSYCNQ